MTKTLKEQLEEFDKEEWEHWHSKSSSFERLPDSTKHNIKQFIIKKHIEYLEGEMERLSQGVYLNDSTREKMGRDYIYVGDMQDYITSQITESKGLLDNNK